MKIAVFGLGKIYQKYKDKLPGSICCMVDNSPDKQGTKIDGINVISPYKLNNYEYSYIVVMALAYDEIREQLQKIGVDEERIVSYKQFLSICGTYPKVHSMGNNIKLEEWFVDNRERGKFLLVSHEFSHTGAPVALMNMALALRQMNYGVIMAGLNDGSLISELKRNSIDYMQDLDLFYETEWFIKIAARFNCIVANTLVVNEFVCKCRELPVKILWWIHETEMGLYKKVELSWLSDNIKFFGGGNRVINFFKNYYTHNDIQKLHYCIPDTGKDMWKINSEQKDIVTFAVIGTIEYRKAQDIVIDVIARLRPQYRKKIKCFMIGNSGLAESDYYKEIKNKMKDLQEINTIGHMDQEQLDHMIEEIDLLICPSREDPMPIVVTQAMMHGKTCIVSENVGQAEYIQQGINGFVFKNQNSEELMKYIIWAIENKDSLNQIGRNSRKIFEEEFSMEAMMGRMREIIIDWDKKETCT